MVYFGCVIKMAVNFVSDLWAHEQRLQIIECSLTHYWTKICHVVQDHYRKQGILISPFLISKPPFLTSSWQRFYRHTLPHISPNFKPAGNDFTQSGHPQAEPTISLYGMAWEPSCCLSAGFPLLKRSEMCLSDIPRLLYHYTACN